jgi:adenine-specific DNA-methyltransferase
MSTSDQPEKLDLSSLDIAAEKQAALRTAFPEAFTEGGKVDFEWLKIALGEMVDAGKERYGMSWPGKAECFRTIQQPSMATLVPAKEESVEWENTENLIIEGDNLEVLKLLQKSYLGKVKMIYIDPPYNTGNDFIYPDNYSESLDTYLRYTGQVDSEGRKYSTNTEADGRFHSKWLNMMYPRLYLARNLLRDDGVIFISIDDAEADNLRKLCIEIFGEENFVAQLIWEKGRKNDAKLFSVGHEYIIVFAKSKAWLAEHEVKWREAKPGAAEIQTEYLRLRKNLGSDTKAIQAKLREFYTKLPKGHPAKKHSRYSNVDEYGVWRDDNMSWPGGGGPKYDVIHPETKKACAIPEGGWRYSTPEKMQSMIESGRVLFREDHTEPPIRKTYLVREESECDEEEETDTGIQVAGSYFYRSALQASNLMLTLFGEKLFENPKDHEVLMRLISYVSSSTENNIVLDFFAGSGTTGHAVLDLNEKDEGNRKFILVQLPEPTERKDFPTIADITKERVRRVIKKLNAEDAGKLDLKGGPKPDRGFKVFKLQSSNFKAWDADIPKESAAVAQQLEMHVHHLVEGCTQEDILFEILLKSGFPLTTPIKEMKLAGLTVYSIAEGAMLICLEKQLTPEVIKEMAALKPERVVCLDEGFAGNDQLKTNAVQTMKTQGVTSFRTV